MALRSDVREEDIIFENMAGGASPPKSLPKSFLIATNITPRNQKTRQTCAAFAASTIREILEMKRNPQFNTRLSPEFIYYHRVNKPHDGMHGRDVFVIMMQQGTVPESTFPYRADEGQVGRPTKKMYREARKYRISNFARVLTIKGAKLALTTTGPCYLCLPLVRESATTFWKRSSKDSIEVEEDSPGDSPRVDSPSEITYGHAVCIVGYNKEGFIIHNSWGERYGMNGTALFPYEDWSIGWECWVPILGPAEEDNKKRCCTS